jgi:glycosyltransferase 2 family protein
MPATGWFVKNVFDLKFWMGIGVSTVFIVLLFREINFNKLQYALSSVDYRFVLLAIILTFVSYFLRAVRWQYLLISDRRISLNSLFPATIIGYMANNLLPARLGEFVRAYLLAQQEKLETPAVFASLVIDRLFDGFTVLLMLLITLFALKLPAGMTEAGTALKAGGVVTFLIYTSVIIFMVILKRHTSRTLKFVSRLVKPFPRSLSERLIPLLGSFIGGINISWKGRHVAALFSSSILIWLFALLPVDMILQGFGINMPITASMFILVLLVFAVMVPASPGFIGTYHYACYQGLSVFGIDASTSVSMALVIHGISFFPVTIAGFFYLWRNRISLKAVQRAGEVI